MDKPRPFPLTVGLAFLALGLIGTLSSDGPSRAEAVSPARVADTPLGARITVAGLVGDVRHFHGGGAAAPVEDCRGGAARVYFPPGVAAPAPWTLALVVGTVQSYEGERELVAESAPIALAAGEGAVQVSAEAIVGDPGGHACRFVAFNAPVVSASTPERTGAPHVLVEVAAGSGTLPCIVHLDEWPVVQVVPGARVTVVGVVALGVDGRPVVHVRA
ncbi:MAG TPA: hypothetical protein VGB42_09160 [Candidatus Thermoplasmatota archaeon]